MYHLGIISHGIEKYNILIFNDLQVQPTTRSCHQPEAWLAHGTHIVIMVIGEVVGLHPELVLPASPDNFRIDFCVRVKAVHTLLPPETPRGGKVPPDAMVELGNHFVTQLFQCIKRLEDWLAGLVTLMDKGIAEFEVGDEKAFAQHRRRSP